MQMRNLSRFWLVIVAAVGLAACTSHELPDEGFVDVPGGRVAFRVVGKGDGVPVLMIHGGPGGTSCTYPSTTGGIAASRPVVMYDQLGSGNSDRMLDMKRDATLDRSVAEVVAIREQLGLEEVHLVGHSWGTAVALEYLLTSRPTGVRSVTFVGPFFSTTRWIRDANGLVESLPNDAQQAIRSAKASGNYDTPEFVAANSLFSAQFLSRAPAVQGRFPACESMAIGFNEELYEYMWGPSEFVSTGTLRDYDRVTRLSELNLPTLFLVGEYDEARPATARQFQELVPGSIVRVIPGAAHAVNVDATQGFNEAIAEFLASVEAH
jgi:proline iminopeptidase